MRRWLPAIALGALIAVGALALLWLVQPSAEPTAAARADALAAELRCPDCQGLAVADSPTSAAREIRRQIDELVATGASDEEVRAHFIARYGEWILLAPSSLLPWLVPFVAVAVGVLGLVAWLIIRGANPATAAPALPLTDAERRRLHEEAEALDA